MTPVPYQYVVLRLVPRVDREEFVNVGVVLYSQQADFLDASFHLDHDRISALAPGLDLEDVEAALSTVCRLARGEGPHGTARMDRLGPRFGWISAPRSTILQPSGVHGGQTEDPARTLEHLLERLVMPV
jgi:hypothetical protein